MINTKRKKRKKRKKHNLVRKNMIVTKCKQIKYDVKDKIKRESNIPFNKNDLGCL